MLFYIDNFFLKFVIEGVATNIINLLGSLLQSVIFIIYF